jgi:hypothetical protein
MDYIIIIGKNWPNDPCANCMLNLNLKQYQKVDEFFTKGNYDLIQEHNFKKELQVEMINFLKVGLGLCGGVVRVGNLCYNWASSS